MPLKIVHSGHVEVVGLGRVLLTSPVTPSSKADLHMGQIAEEAALTSRSFAVIGRLKGEFSEPERARLAEQDLRKSIEGFLDENEIKFVLELEGKMEPGIEVSVTGTACSDSTFQLVKSRLAKEFSINTDDSKETVQPDGLGANYSREDANSDFLVEGVRLLFGNEERQFQKEKIIKTISEIAELLDARTRTSQDTNATAAA